MKKVTLRNGFTFIGRLVNGSRESGAMTFEVDSNDSREITSRQFCKEGILIKEFSVTLYSPWTDAKGTFRFDNYCEQDNAAEFEAFEKFIGEN